MINAAGQAEETQNKNAEPGRQPSHGSKTLKSADLFHGSKEICIDHNGAVYRLRITRQDKLVLNK